MNVLESTKLYKDLQLVSTKYAHLEIGSSKKDISYSNKLNSLLEFYKSNINQVKERSHFISLETRNNLKNSNPKDIYKLIVDLNSFALSKYNFLRTYNIDTESASINAVILPTVEELILVNESIRNKDYLSDKNTYFYIYEKVVINAFVIFLALKDMTLEKEKVHSFSQAILSQIQILSIISI